MDVTAHSYEVGEPNQAGAARRGAMRLAHELGLGEVDTGRVGIVVTEAATNMLKHARGGRMLLQPFRNGGGWGLDALALDSGPGLRDLGVSMRDGFSTAGTNGTGFGAIARQSSRFDVYSAPGKGTAVFAGVGAAGREPGSAGIGGVCVPIAGETVCGDGWSFEARDGRCTVCVVDGLGHGPLAHEAAARAIDAFHRGTNAPLDERLRRVHDALRPTRGAAAALAEVGPDRRELRFCGVGNVTGRMFGATGERHLVSHFGTLGHDVRRFQVFTYPWSVGGTLVLHTDGLGTHWALDDYPGLAGRHPTLVAGVLFRDHARGRDDCTVVVARLDA